MGAYQFCNIAPNQEEDIESWNDDNGWKQFVWFQYVGVFECHNHFYDAWNGWNSEEDEYVVPRAIIRCVVFDKDQRGGSQLHEHVYAQYNEV